MDKASSHSTPLTRRTILRTTVATAALGVPAVALSATDTDAPIIAAEAEIARLYAWINQQPGETREQEHARQPAFDRVYQFEDFIAEAKPSTAAGAASKLRRLLDVDVGIVTGASESDFPSMLLILDFLQSIAGAPTHPTRPVWSEEAEEVEPGDVS